jgi:hypothetical protein
MKRALLVINHAYLFFGTTVYVGVLWALHFFWYPSWESMTVEIAQSQFIVPTSAATRFFLVVVPLMFFANIVMVVSERRDRKMLAVSLLGLGLQCVVLYVGWGLIIPVNKTIAARLADHSLDQAELSGLLTGWMHLNDVRWLFMSAMWLVMMYYFIAKGRLIERVGVQATLP